MPVIPILFLSVVLHAWVGWRLAPALSSVSTTAAACLWAVLLASALLMPLGLMARRLRAGALTASLTWAGLLFMGLFSTLMVLALLRDAVLALSLVTAVVAGFAGVDAAWLDPLQVASAVAVPLLAFLATVWGFWAARRTARVVRVDVPITGLPATLHGFSVAQISDIHVGPTIRKAYVKRIVARVNALGADMVAITGDLVDGHVDDLRQHVAPLATLASTHGTFFVTGNHEYYSGAHAWVDELRRLGIQVLMNEHRVLHHEAGQGAGCATVDRDTEMVVVAGVADYGAHHFDEGHRSDPVAALAGAPTGARMRLLLAHQPRSAPAAASAGFDLQLSGHTHGGQFWPWMHFVQFQQPFTAGLHRLANLWVYTNRGTGYWGPPKRFGVSSEITHLRLVPV
jgi:uncharacterized protein